jgi:hypothetical protein
VARERAIASQNMNLDSIKEFFNKLDSHDWAAIGAGVAGLVLLMLVFKSGKMIFRLLCFLIAVGLFAGAWWWHTHK